MKLQTALLALAFVSGTSAFAPKALDASSSTALYSSDLTRGGNNQTPDLSRGNPTPRPNYNRPQVNSRVNADSIRQLWDEEKVEIVQGRSLRTWSFMSPAIERVQVLMRTEGRPLNADVELWQGPDNTPQKMSVYIEDGDFRPFSAVIESPRGSNTVAIRNTANMEFPLLAMVEPDIRGAGGQTPPLAAATTELRKSRGKTVQGGAIVTYPFDPSVAKVSVVMKTDGRPLNARLELLQGPNNNKQVIEVYTEDGMERPFQLIIDTPGTGNVVRVINTATVEFPLTAAVEPFLVEDYKYDQQGSSSGRSMQSQNSGSNDFFFSKP